MRIICSHRLVSDCQRDPALYQYMDASFHYDGGELPVQVGRYYTVYALLLTDLGSWGFILEDESDPYPVAFPLALFQVSHNRLSRYWRYGGRQPAFSGALRKATGILAFSEWVDDHRYYEWLVDGDPKAEAVFSKYKKLIDEEAG